MEKNKEIKEKKRRKEKKRKEKKRKTCCASPAVHILNLPRPTSPVLVMNEWMMNDESKKVFFFRSKLDHVKFKRNKCAQFSSFSLQKDVTGGTCVYIPRRGQVR